METYTENSHQQFPSNVKAYKIKNKKVWQKTKEPKFDELMRRSRVGPTLKFVSLFLFLPFFFFFVAKWAVATYINNSFSFPKSFLTKSQVVFKHSQKL